MYNFFCRNLSSYLMLVEGENDYRSRISQVLRGLLDKKLYDRWQYEEPDKYAELNNIIFFMKQRQDKYELFHTLVYDLWALDFKAKKNDRFKLEVVDEQLKLINLCVKGTYLDIEIEVEDASGQEE